MYGINVAKRVTLEPTGGPGDTIVVPVVGDDTYFDVQFIASAIGEENLPAIDLIVSRQGQEGAPTALTGLRMATVDVGTVPGVTSGENLTFNGSSWVAVPQTIHTPAVACVLRNTTAGRVTVQLNIIGKARRLLWISRNSSVRSVTRTGLSWPRSSLVGLSGSARPIWRGISSRRFPASTGRGSLSFSASSRGWARPWSRARPGALRLSSESSVGSCPLAVTKSSTPPRRRSYMPTTSIISIIVAILGFLFGTAMSVISYFIKKDFEALTKQVADLQKLDYVERSDLDAFRKELESKLKELEHAGKELDKKIDRLERASITDDHDARSVTAQKIDELRRELQDHKLQVNTWQAAAAEKYVNRTDFVRDNTHLDTKISGVHRSIRGMEESLDGLLKKYLKP